eukprot:gene14026-15485_t
MCHWFVKVVSFLSLVVFSLFICCESARVDVVHALTTLQYNEASGILPVYLTEASNINAVNVSCTQLPSGPRQARVVFEDAVIPVSSSSGNVTIKIISAGEAVTVSCYGISQNGGAQYAKVNSTGKVGSIIITKPPNVDICLEYIYVKDYTNAIQTFDVTLSEHASRPVSVDCFVIGSSLPSNLQLQFERASIPVSQNTVKIPFRVTRSGNPVKVACRAQDSQCLSSVPSIPVSSSPVSTASIISTIATSIAPNASVASSNAVSFSAEVASITAYLAASEMRSSTQHVSFIVLDRALEGTSNMDLQCDIKSILVNQTQHPICDPTTGLPIPQSGASNQATLELLEKKITFKPGDISKNITIKVKKLSNESIFQLFHAFCCTPLSNAKYKNQTVSVYLWINSLSNVAFSWTTVPDQTKRTMTAVSKLDFSCPCNLNGDTCDLNCCCDKTCSNNELQRFICINGAFGGRLASSFEFSCQATWPDKRDWTPVLCVVTNNSPFLGYFYKYTSPALVASLADYNKLVSGKSIYDYQESEARNSLQSNTIGYTYGFPIKTSIGFLAMPFQFQDNTCLFKTVEYMKDSKTRCLHKATSQSCMLASFNALNYAMPSGITNPACTVPGILDGASANSQVAKTVEYYCLQNISSYVILPNSNQAQPDEESLFTGGSSSNPATRCAFDDSKTRPPVPVFDSQSNSCSNAVFDVNYVMYWNGGQLKSVAAKVTLGSFQATHVTLSPVTYAYYTTRIIASTPSRGYTATPSTVAMSSASINSSTTTNNTSIAQQSVSRIVPSYTGTLFTAQKPVATITPMTSLVSNSSSISIQPSVANNTIINITITVRTSTVVLKNFTIVPSIVQKFAVLFSYSIASAGNASTASVSINASASNVIHRSGNPGYVIGKPLISQTQAMIGSSSTTTLGLLLWKPTKTSLCSDAQTTPITFGKDASSGCLLRFGMDQFSNCTSLIEMVKQQQNNLIKAIKVAKRGNPSGDIASDWLDVVSLPTTTTVVNLTRDGVCHGVPSHFHVEILIAEAGLSYKSETWSMPCATGANARCFNTSVANSQRTTPLLSPFQIKSSVSFVIVPAVEPVAVKRSADVSGICRYDACTGELFYPLTNAYSTGVIDFNLVLTQNAAAMAVTLMFIAFGTLYIARPWKL